MPGYSFLNLCFNSSTRQSVILKNYFIVSEPPPKIFLNGSRCIYVSGYSKVQVSGEIIEKSSCKLENENNNNSSQLLTD